MRANNQFEYNGIRVHHAHSFLNVRTSSHIRFRSRPRGIFPPFPFPERTPKAVSNSAFTSLAKAALHRNRQRNQKRPQTKARIPVTSSDRSAWASKVEFRAPSCGMMRAGWPTRVTASFAPWGGAGSANKRSRILSTDKFDAPQTSKRIGLGLTGCDRSELPYDFDERVRLSGTYTHISLSAGIHFTEWYSPGGPCIHATSTDSSANRTAAFWLSLSESSKKGHIICDVTS
jgi:hypothetical protein